MIFMRSMILNPIRLAVLRMSNRKWTILVMTIVSVMVLNMRTIMMLNIRTMMIMMNNLGMLLSIMWMGIFYIVIMMNWNVIIRMMRMVIAAMITMTSMISMVSIKIVCWSFELMLVIVIVLTVSLSDVNRRWTGTLYESLALSE
jgi:hypothetical protein